MDRQLTLAHPRQGPGFREGVLHDQHFQHFLYALPADGSILIPPPPAEGAAHGGPDVRTTLPAPGEATGGPTPVPLPSRGRPCLLAEHLLQGKNGVGTIRGCLSHFNAAGRTRMGPAFRKIVFYQKPQRSTRTGPSCPTAHSGNAGWDYMYFRFVCGPGPWPWLCPSPRGTPGPGTQGKQGQPPGCGDGPGFSQGAWTLPPCVPGVPEGQRMEWT